MEPARINPFTDRVMLITTIASVNTTSYVSDHPLKARECALLPCAQQYQTEVERGILNRKAPIV